MGRKELKVREGENLAKLKILTVEDAKQCAVEDDFTFTFPSRIAAQQGFQLDAGGEVFTTSNMSGKYLCCECPANTTLSELFV